MREIEPAPLVLVEGTNPHTLRAHVRREWRRGNLVPRTGVAEIRPGIWAVEVDQLRPMTRPWVRPVAVTVGALGTLAGAATLGWWLLSTVTALVAGVGLGAILCVAALGWLTVAAFTPDHRGCETTVIIRHRH